MTELTHRDIYERLAKLEVLIDEREHTRQQSRERQEKTLEQILERIGKLEIAAVSDKAALSEADKWRGRVYVVLRYFLPPSLGATVMYWIMTHWSGHGS